MNIYFSFLVSRFSSLISRIMFYHMPFSSGILLHSGHTSICDMSTKNYFVTV